MITLECKLAFENKEEKEKVLSLMRGFSSAQRYAYKRLLAGEGRNELKKQIPGLFGINTRYADDAILKAQAIITSCRERGQNPRKVVFGGRALFEKLRSHHISEKKRIRYKREWREKRQGSLYSRGDRSRRGNLNLRFLFEDERLTLRINTGNRDYVVVRVIRSVSRKKDKWIDFLCRLFVAEMRNEYFPYTVELKLKGGEVYAFVRYEEPIPPKTLTRDRGVIGIDLNASPFHLAWVEVDEDGNLKSYGRVDLSSLIGKNKNQRKNLLWEVAYEVVELAKSKGRAIALEDLKKFPKGRRGDGRGKLRKRLYEFVYKGILEKVEVLAVREGVEVVRVNPAYTSVIGTLKYAPQYLIDKDIAAAYVIGRRGMGFTEKIPRNYSALLSDGECLDAFLDLLEERIRDLRYRIKSEKDQYKRKALKAELKALLIGKKELLELVSSECEPASRKRTSGWNKSVRGLRLGRQKSWRVLRAVVTFSLLGKSFLRDFSPLRPTLVSGDWKRVVKGRVPAPGAGASSTVH